MSKKDTNIYYCIGCNKIHTRGSFYTSFNSTHQNGIYPFCKKYIKDTVYISDTNINANAFKELLRQMDAPFFHDLWESSLAGKIEAIGAYFRNINMVQYRGLTWKDSMNEDIEAELDEASAEVEVLTVKTADSLTEEELRELEVKWGFGYDLDEYILFERKWNTLIDNYGRKTSMHTEGLKTYIRFRVKEELATARGDVKEAKEWGQLASKAAQDAKINVSQLSKSDISGGIDVLPQLFEAVESEVGIIPQLPKLLEQPYDDADIIIWCNINYMRRLEDKPRVPYRDIWNFYDEMLEEHCKQKGYNAHEVEEFKKKRRVPYRNLEDIYIEPVYEDGDL